MSLARLARRLAFAARPAPRRVVKGSAFGVVFAAWGALAWGPGAPAAAQDTPYADLIRVKNELEARFRGEAPGEPVVDARQRDELRRQIRDWEKQLRESEARVLELQLTLTELTQKLKLVDRGPVIVGGKTYDRATLLQLQTTLQTQLQAHNQQRARFERQRDELAARLEGGVWDGAPRWRPDDPRRDQWEILLAEINAYVEMRRAQRDYVDVFRGVTGLNDQLRLVEIKLLEAHARLRQLEGEPGVRPRPPIEGGERDGARGLLSAATSRAARLEIDLEDARKLRDQLRDELNAVREGKTPRPRFEGDNPELAKLDDALRRVREHLDGAPDRPLILEGRETPRDRLFDKVRELLEQRKKIEKGETSAPPAESLDRRRLELEESSREIERVVSELQGLKGRFDGFVGELRGLAREFDEARGPRDDLARRLARAQDVYAELAAKHDGLRRLLREFGGGFPGAAPR